MKSWKATSRRVRRATAVLPAGACLAFVGCGGADGSNVAPPSQIALKVNGDEITARQIDLVAQQQQRDAMGDREDTSQQQAIQRLIDQQIAVQNAHRLKLDRDPDTVQRVEQARREVLASAFLDTVANKAPRPSEAEIRRYYDAHPGLFADRRVYTLQRAQVQAPADEIAALQARADRAGSFGEVAAWLRAERVGFTVDSLSQPAEALPLAIVDRLATLARGRSIALPRPGGAWVLTVVGAQPAPRSFEDARADIEQFLSANAMRDAVLSAERRLREDARIEYVGAYASAPTALSLAASAAH